MGRSVTAREFWRATVFCLAACMVLAVAAATARAGTAPVAPEAPKPELNSGFRSLYNLHFDEARSIFAHWQRLHPDDPMGSTAEAASYLFEEFYEQGVLTSEFFLNDKRLLGGIAGKGDPARTSAFVAADDRARELARRALDANPQDSGALLAMTMAIGMRSDYEGIIERHQMESVHFLHEAEGYAHSLLAIAPDSGDAYVALGAGNYIVGCLPGYKRAILRIGGVRGDKADGMQQMAMAAAHGVYLRPFAQILLALAAVREKQIGLARSELLELSAEFPQNPLFARELAKLPEVSAQSSAGDGGAVAR